MAHRKVCKHCGGTEEAHHDYEPSMPDGCVCDAGEWGDVVTEVCHEYQPAAGHFDEADRCRRCEHDKACHKGPTET